MRKKKEQAIITHVAANDIFGNFRFFKKDNGEILFVGKDVAEILGYKDTDKAIRDHVDAEDQELLKPADLAGLKIPNRGLIFINESGLYSLIFGSQLPEAKKFTRWVTSEVLPSIRKTGSYSLPREETVTIQIKGSKNLNAFKKNHPNIKFSEKAYLTGTYFEDGVDREETFIRYDLTLNINDYKKIEQKNSFDRLFISN